MTDIDDAEFREFVRSLFGADDESTGSWISPNNDSEE